MKVNKEIRQLAREMMKASFIDGQLDRGKIGSLVESLMRRKPRHTVEILQYYKRLLRLELEKRQARVESAAALEPHIGEEIVAGLKRKYGEDLSAEFAVDPGLLGGMRIRVGNDVWDGSVRNRLERLQRQL